MRHLPTSDLTTLKQNHFPQEGKMVAGEVTGKVTIEVTGEVDDNQALS